MTSRESSGNSFADTDEIGGQAMLNDVLWALGLDDTSDGKGNVADHDGQRREISAVNADDVSVALEFLAAALIPIAIAKM